MAELETENQNASSCWDGEELHWPVSRDPRLQSPEYIKLYFSPMKRSLEVGSHGVGSGCQGSVSLKRS